MPPALPRLTARSGALSTSSRLGSLAARSRRAVAPAKAKTKREQQHEELFSHYVLNKDPAASKYMPYDEVAYPSLVRKARAAGELQESAPQELEHLYFAGHLDYLRRTEQKRVAASMRPFLAPPGGKMLPGAALEMGRQSVKMRKVATRERNEKKRDADRDFLGFKKKPHLLRRNEPEMKSPSDLGKSLSEHEELRLRHLASTLLFDHKPSNPYKQANRSLRRAMRRRRPRRVEATLKVDHVGDVVDRYREEARAQRVIGRAFRIFVKRRRLERRLEQNRVVVSLQACMRGVVARKLVAVWYRKLVIITIKWQARIRRALCQINFERRWVYERQVYVVIHAGARGFLSRRRVLRKRRNLCATKLQVLWRGARGRCVADRKWLEGVVVPIQRKARGMRSRSRYVRVKEEVYAATLRISRCYRGYSGRRDRNRALYERESSDLRDLLALLGSEAQAMQDRARKTEKRIAKKNLHATAQKHRDKVSSLCDEVITTEARYLLLIQEKERLTPRAISGGYRDEMDTNIAEYRQIVTKLKTEVLFGALVDLRASEGEIKASEAIVTNARFFADEANSARDKELRAIWRRESRTRHDAALLDKRRAIGDQRRAWRVSFYTASGKPKKAWALHVDDENPMAQAHAGVYCSGTANLLAFENTEKHRLGSEEALEALDDKIRLQSWLNQVEQVEQLFEPLAEPLAKMQRMSEGMVDVDGADYTKMCTEEPVSPPSAFEEWKSSPKKNSTALVVQSPSEETYDFFDDASTRPASPVKIAWEAPPAVPKKVYYPRHRTKRPNVSRIPWSLLDELDAEKQRFAMEQVGDTFKERFAEADAKKKKARRRF